MLFTRQIILNHYTVIEACNEVVNGISMLPTFNFIPLSELNTVQGGKLVDVLGVIREVSPLQTRTIRKTSKETPMKDIQVADQSMAQVSVTLWSQKIGRAHV